MTEPTGLNSEENKTNQTTTVVKVSSKCSGVQVHRFYFFVFNYPCIRYSYSSKYLSLGASMIFPILAYLQPHYTLLHEHIDLSL